MSYLCLYNSPLDNEYSLRNLLKISRRPHRGRRKLTAAVEKSEDAWKKKQHNQPYSPEINKYTGIWVTQLQQTVHMLYYYCHYETFTKQVWLSQTPQPPEQFCYTHREQFCYSDKKNSVNIIIQLTKPIFSK